MAVLTIGEVARHARVGVETIRYSEREGIIPNPPRSSSGYRQLPPETMQRRAVGSTTSCPAPSRYGYR